MEKLSQNQGTETLETIIKKQQIIINRQKTAIFHLKTVIKKLSQNNDEKDTKIKAAQNIYGNQHLPKAVNTVLLVEDHPIATKIAKNILLDLNCQIDVAVDGKTAIKLTKNHYYDLIFMDIGLPDISGYEVTQTIRSRELTTGNHVPIIALTAHGDIENQQLCLEAGMNAIITKPLRKLEAKNVLNVFGLEQRKQLVNKQQYAITEESSLKSDKEIIDLEQAKILSGGNEKVMQEILTTFLKSLPVEVKKLQSAYQEAKWETISKIVHKLKGCASYCATLRLQSACAQLDNSIKSGAHILLHELYRQLLSEIKLLQKFCGNRILSR